MVLLAADSRLADPLQTPSGGDRKDIKALKMVAFILLKSFALQEASASGNLQHRYSQLSNKADKQGSRNQITLALQE